ncbi:pilus assembly protein CpaB [Vibrio harveyi]|nr:pilus assembly protein CpaB [Vibrio harveyi]
MNSKVILVLAAIAISVGLYGVTQSQPTAPVVQTQQPKKEEKKFKVWTLKRDLKRGEALQRRDLVIEYLTESQAAQQGIDSDIKLDWSKRLIAVEALNQGEWVTKEVLTSPGESDYLSTMAKPGYAPFNITVPGDDVVGGTIAVGDLVDISVISTMDQNLSADNTVSDIEHLTMTPLIAQVPVLYMISKQRLVSTLTDQKTTDVTLVLQVTNRQLAKLSVAKRIAEITVHKSIGEQFVDQLHANSSDVIRFADERQTTKTQSIKEYRFN